MVNNELTCIISQIYGYFVYVVGGLEVHFYLLWGVCARAGLCTMIGGQGVAGAHRVTGTLGLEAVWVSVIVGSGTRRVNPVVNKLLLPPGDAERRRRLLVALLGVSQNCRDIVHVWSCKQSESKSKISVSGENRI